MLYAGQPVGMIVAKSQELAQKAAAYVKIKYSAVAKPFLTVKEVLKSGDKARIKPFGKIVPTDPKGKYSYDLSLFQWN